MNRVDAENDEERIEFQKAVIDEQPEGNFDFLTEGD